MDWIKSIREKAIQDDSGFWSEQTGKMELPSTEKENVQKEKAKES